MKCKYCNEQAEWADEYCQFHWEEYCSAEFWKAVTGDPKLIRKFQGRKLNEQ